MIAKAARLAFVMGIVEHKPVTISKLMSVAKAPHKKAVKTMLVREAQRFLRTGLGLDLVPFVNDAAPLKNKPKKKDYTLETRRDWKRAVLVMRPTEDGRVAATKQNHPTTDMDPTLGRNVTRQEQVRRGVTAVCLGLLSKAPLQRLGLEELMGLLARLDPHVAAAVGPDWQGTVKAWLRDAAAVRTQVEELVKVSGDVERTEVAMLAPGARASWGITGVFDFLLQTAGESAALADRAKWYGDERLAVPEPEDAMAAELDDEDLEEEAAAAADKADSPAAAHGARRASKRSAPASESRPKRSRR